MGERARLGRPVAQVQPTVREQGFLEILDQVYRTGELLCGRRKCRRLLTPAGCRPLARAIISTTLLWPCLMSTATATGVLSFALDVTERVRARQQAEALAAEVRRRDEQVRAITASVPVFIFNFDPSGVITYTNPYFYEYTGLDPDAPAQRCLGWRCRPTTGPPLSAVAQAAMAAGEPWQATFRCRRHDGELRWFQTKVAALLRCQRPAGRLQRGYGGNSRAARAHRGAGPQPHRLCRPGR